MTATKISGKFAGFNLDDEVRREERLAREEARAREQQDAEKVHPLDPKYANFSIWRYPAQIELTGVPYKNRTFNFDIRRGLSHEHALQEEWLDEGRKKGGPTIASLQMLYSIFKAMYLHRNDKSVKKAAFSLGMALQGKTICTSSTAVYERVASQDCVMHKDYSHGGDRFNANLVGHPGSLNDLDDDLAFALFGNTSGATGKEIATSVFEWFHGEPSLHRADRVERQSDSH